MDVLFFAFANDRDNPLPNLEKEDELIYSLLAPRQAQMHFMVHRDSFADLDQITEFLTLYRKRIVLFHYSGHADGNGLLMGGEDAKARGIAELLAQCERLKLVVLNGCSTQGQVRLLQEKNIPVVIATSAPVADNKAAEFSIQFYRSLANQENINEAYDAAKGKVLTMDDTVHMKIPTLLFGACFNKQEWMKWGSGRCPWG
jgi:CHAT domain